MYLAPVFASEVPRIWHEVRPLVDKALARADGEQLSEDVLQKLLNKEININEHNIILCYY